MGNLLENLTHDKSEQIAKNFIFHSNIKHLQLGDIKILQYKENKNVTVFQKRIMTTSKEQLDNLQSYYQSRSLFSHKNLVKLIDISVQDNTLRCSELSEILITGEYFSKTLNQEAERIITQSQFCTESRLWYIAYQIIDACAYLEEQGKYQGDLKTQSIYLDDEQNIKLIEYNFISGSPDAYEKAQLSNDFYLAPPELLIDLKQQSQFPQNIKNNSDVFTLGLILLELASQNSSAAYYNWAKKQLDLGQISQRIQSLASQGYSTIFQKLLTEMTGDLTHRPSFVVIRNGLKKLEQQILNGEQFYINHIKKSESCVQKEFQTFGSKI